MTIRRKPLAAEQPYTVFANALLNDRDLGADALGVLVYLLSKPSNWTVRISELKDRFGCGRDKIYRIMDELIQIGYAERDQDRSNDGKFGDRSFLVSNEKMPRPENQEAASAADLPLTEKPTLQKKERKQNNDSYSEEFEKDVWAPYPRKAGTSKKKAWDQWRMLNDENQARVKAAIPLYAAMMRKEGRTEDKIKHLEFWISGRIYETIAVAPAAPAAAVPAQPWHETATREQWERVIKIYGSMMDWRPAWGPAPGKPGCGVPDDLIETLPYGLRPESKQAVDKSPRPVAPSSDEPSSFTPRF